MQHLRERTAALLKIWSWKSQSFVLKFRYLTIITEIAGLGCIDRQVGHAMGLILVTEECMLHEGPAEKYVLQARQRKRWTLPKLFVR
jgi:hypothetical protein